MQNAVKYACFSKRLPAIVQCYQFRLCQSDAGEYTFQHNFTANQVTKILSTVNNNPALTDYAISKSRIKKIESWRSKNGEFKSLNELLDLETFGVKVLEKFCESVVNEQKKGQLVKPGKEKGGRAIAQFITPTMLNPTDIESCVSIHLSVNTISWARFAISSEKQPTTVTDWRFYTFDDKKLSLADLVQVILYLDRLIPTADAYILEAPLVAQQTAPGSPVQININVQKSQIISMVAVTLANRDKPELTDGVYDPQQSVFFLKQYLTSRLFRILVGTERVSNEQVIEQLLRTHYNADSQTTGNLQRELNVPFELRKYYAEVDRKESNKDHMGQALLIGLTFIRLCVVQCAESLAIVENRKK